MLFSSSLVPFGLKETISKRRIYPSMPVAKDSVCRRTPVPFCWDSLLQKVLPPISISLGFSDFGPAAVFLTSSLDSALACFAVTTKVLNPFWEDWNPIMKWPHVAPFMESFNSWRSASCGNGSEKPKNALVYFEGDKNPVSGASSEDFDLGNDDCPVEYATRQKHNRRGNAPERNRIGIPPPRRTGALIVSCSLVGRLHNFPCRIRSRSSGQACAGVRAAAAKI